VREQVKTGGLFFVAVSRSTLGDGGKQVSRLVVLDEHKRYADRRNGNRKLFLNFILV
jgi:hypothetical protein